VTVNKNRSAVMHDIVWVSKGG